MASAIELAMESPRRDVEITFHGGEPLLEFPAIRRGIEYAERVRPAGKRIKYRVVTNGTLVTPAITDFLVRHHVQVQLSFDGIRQVQEARAPGSFDILDRLLHDIRTSHPAFYRQSLVVSVTLAPSGIPYLAASVDYFLAKDVRMLDINPVVTACPDWDHDCIGELDAQFARIFESSMRHLDRTGRVPFLLFGNKEDRPTEAVRSRAMCEVGTNRSPVVDVDGTVYGCALFAESLQEFTSPLLTRCLRIMRLGDIRDPGFADRCDRFTEAVEGSRMFARKERKYSSYARCSECPYFSTCVVCPASIGHIKGNADPDRVPDFYCAYSLVSQKYCERFPRQPKPRELILGNAYTDHRLRWKALAEAMRSP